MTWNRMQGWERSRRRKIRALLSEVGDFARAAAGHDGGAANAGGGIEEVLRGLVAGEDRARVRDQSPAGELLAQGGSVDRREGSARRGAAAAGSDGARLDGGEVGVNACVAGAVAARVHVADAGTLQDGQASSGDTGAQTSGDRELRGDL